MFIKTAISEAKVPIIDSFKGKNANQGVIFIRFLHKTTHLILVGLYFSNLIQHKKNDVVV